MRILMVVTTRFGRNGLTAVALNYARAFPPEEALVDFVCLNAPEEELTRELRDRGSRFFVLPMRLKNPVLYVKRLAAIVRAGGYDAVHAHGNSCTLAFDLLGAALGGVKLRVAHSHNTTCTYRLAHRLLRPLFELLAVKRCACSTEAGRWLFHNRPFVILGNGVDTARFAYSEEKRAAARRELEIGGGVSALLHVGSFIPRKNQAFLLPLVMGLRQRGVKAVLVFVGTGPDREKVERAAREMGVGDNVRFAGESADPASLYSAGDVFLLPSVHEGLPLTLVEAQCAGLRCVASDSVSKEADVGNRIRFLPIDAGIQPWIQETNRILSTAGGEKRSDGGEMTWRAGFDIEYNARLLLEQYRGWIIQGGGRHAAQ